MNLIKFKTTTNERFRIPKAHIEWHQYMRTPGMDEATVTFGMKSGQQIYVTVDVDVLIEIEEALGVKRLAD